MAGKSELKNEEKNLPKKTYPEGNWKRKTSYAMGEYLKMEDEMMTTIRGGKRIELVKNLSHHVPVIPIGNLDDYGKELLDAMLEGNASIMEIVEFFKNYKPTPGLKFNKKAFQETQEAKNEEGSKDSESEEDEADKNEIKEIVSKPKKETKEENIQVEVSKKEVNATNQKEVKVTKKDVKEDKKEVKVAEKPKKINKVKEKEVKKIIPPNPDYVFDLNDPDFLKIPFMHPDKKEHTFEEWFKILYSVCDPKGLTDAECVDVMEIRMGGSYLEELKEMKAKNYELYKIEQHFLRKDIILDPGYIFDLNDPDFLKIPFMHPDKQTHTFENWFEILYSVCDPKGLSDDQCVDVMEIRMGGSYLEELKQMKLDKWELEAIELHFLSKDIQEDDGLKDEKFQLVRGSCKDKWGVHMSYSKSSGIGLHLVIDNIRENSPAWNSGLRPMDCIVSVHDWMITLMDKAEPQVALSLFQACGNVAVLSILKSHGVDEDLSSMGWV